MPGGIEYPETKTVSDRDSGLEGLEEAIGQYIQETSREPFQRILVYDEDILIGQGQLSRLEAFRPR